MISYEMRPLEAPLARVENGFYKIIGIDKDKQMTWKEYSLALMLTNIIVGAFVFFMLVFQNVLQSSTHVNGLSIDLAFMQAISFITNTDLQHYVGEQSFSVISQMVVLSSITKSYRRVVKFSYVSEASLNESTLKPFIGTNHQLLTSYMIVMIITRTSNSKRCRFGCS